VELIKKKMKKIVFIVAFTVLATYNSIAQEINWVTFDEAIALQKKAPKKIMMDVYTNWCGPCKMLDKNTFQNADVAEYVNKHYYAVKFNGEGNETVTYKDNTFGNPNYNPANANRRNSAHQLASYLQIGAYPTIVFFDETAEVITPLRGYQTPPQLELYLKMFKADEHKNITTQEEFNTYYGAFKSEFKG
jgi:thioredoxin-related protein